MRRRRASVGVVLATLSLSWAVAAGQFEHPDLKSGKAAVRTVLVLPPKVTVAKSGVKGQESLIEEAQKVEAALPAIVTKVLQGKGCKVLQNPFEPQALEKDSDLKYALADLQGRFDVLSEQLNRKPKDVRNGRFTLGDEVTKFNPGASADALVFVRGEGVITTGGKKAFATVFGGLAGAAASANHIFVNVAVVDARTGAILYYSKAFVTGDFVKEPEHMTNPIEKSFKNFVGPAGSEKKASAD